MIRLKKLLESFEKVSNLLSDPDNNAKMMYQLLDAFKSEGGEILGQGRFATVLFHPSWKYVVKIFSSDVPYLKFVRFVMKNPRKSFPVFFDKPRKIIPNYKRHKSDTYLYVVKTELLSPISIREYDDMQYYLYYDKEDAKLMMDNENDPSHFSYNKSGAGTWTFIYNKLVKMEIGRPWLVHFKQDYNFLMQFDNNIGSPDIHSKNIMKRQNGEFVLADPFWVGENPYQTHDRLLKSEIGYNDDHEDSEKDMVMGGEKFKKPKPVKPAAYKPEPSDSDELPF